MMAKQSCLLSFFNRSDSATPKKEVSKTIKLKGVELTELCIVWGKLEGHPWWPGIICLPPLGDTFLRKNAVHMQFFEDPPSRGWVRESFLKPYGDPMKVGVPTYKDQGWKKAKALADDAAKLPLEERRSLLVTHELSDVEMQDDEESDAVTDEGNSSKENIDTSCLSESVSPKANKKRAKRKSDSEQPAKRRKIVLLSESDESADEYKPEKEEDSSDESVSSGVDENEVSKDEPLLSENELTPSPSSVKKSKAASKKQTASASNGCMTPKMAATPYTPSAPPFTPYTPTAPPYSPAAASASPSLKSKLSLFAAKESVEAESEGGYTKPSFLLPENIKDAAGRRPDHPDYDCRTLYVPESFLNQQTPCHRQWWKFKSQHFDTVLFFKMGKFYEFFYMDAEIGVQELGFILMKGAVPHSGFPEISYGRYSASLIEKGYKVARIEQTETPDMMEKRCKATPKCSKFDRVVRREVCQLTSVGTRVWGVQDAELSSTVPSYLLALTAQSKDDSTMVGVAFIDTSLGVFHLGQFSDDRHHSRLRTLLAHHPPAQVGAKALLTERNKLPGGVRQVLAQCGVPPNLHESLTPSTEFWTAEKTLQFLALQDCLKADHGSVDWPEQLKSFLTDDCTMAVEGKSELSISALGALLWYLQRCYLHAQLLSRKLFQVYTPPDLQQESLSAEQCPKQRVVFKQQHMVIDGSSMVNLEVLRNNSTGEVAGSLYALLDYTSTPMGKRLLQQWVSGPLMCCEGIKARQEAVLELRQLGAAVENTTTLLAKLPDIERLLPRIHSQGLHLSSSDPNTRAVLFEEQQYSKKRVLSFLTVIQAFHSISKLPSLFNEVESQLLRSVVSRTDEGGKLPAMDDALIFFQKAFDHELAKKEGKIIPSSGVDQQYDDAIEAIEHTKDELDHNLKKECKFFGAKVVYFGNDRKRYQLEVPEAASKLATSDYELVSQRKGFKRFSTARCKELLAQMSAAEEAREAALKDIARRIFQQFDDKQSLWSAAVECVATLDVLISLTKYSLSIADAATPQVVHAASPHETFIDIREGLHPCILSSHDDIIPNDVVMGQAAGEEAHSSLVLVTGPNMGGKSTLMRQTALLTIMAQIGSLVPCSSMRLTPVDRIFTRVGASDRMLAGESTFLLELRETASILQHATPHALVLIDELGRGTATHDGTAVAWAVAGALVERGCRTLFSTHYHSLVHHFAQTPGVSMGHMACMVEEADEETGKEETITFLYKFCSGVCPKSYGFNAARLAEVPASVVQKGRAASKLMEGRSDAVVAIKTIFSDSASLQEKRKVLENLSPVLEALNTSLA
ncbi:DNA mismatch repair protein MutS clamp [Trinorchestia longiramus]|nr:DNA mismatch repair protein MutS clamp [Trinorchestia longiramus]